MRQSHAAPNLSSRPWCLPLHCQRLGGRPGGDTSPGHAMLVDGWCASWVCWTKTWGRTIVKKEHAVETSYLKRMSHAKWDLNQQSFESSTAGFRFGIISLGLLQQPKLGFHTGIQECITNIHPWRAWFLNNYPRLRFSANLAWNRFWTWTWYCPEIRRNLINLHRLHLDEAATSRSEAVAKETRMVEWFSMCWKFGCLVCGSNFDRRNPVLDLAHWGREWQTGVSIQMQTLQKCPAKFHK